jgi:ParB family chromosome partitioning protein
MSEIEKQTEVSNPNDPKREKVRVISLQYVDDFPDHPFQVKEDEDMEKLIESIRNNGVLNPIIVRRKEDERYEIISGHRRKYACKKLGMDLIPMIVRDISRDEAVIAMVDSNLQREVILPSERAKAYKMKLDAMKRQGKRTDLTSPPLAEKLKDRKLSVDIIAEQQGCSADQIHRYVRLNELTPELLEFVDEGKIGLRPAVELSYLQEEEMRDLVDFIDTADVFPSHAQAIRMKELSREGNLDTDMINEIMGEEKPNQKPKIRISMERLERYFPSGTPQKQVEDTIIKALEFYRQRKREDRDAR